MYHAYCVCVCVCVCVSRLSVRVVWSVCHCVSPLPLPPPASHPRGHRLPVGGGRLHRGVGRPLPLHQQEAVFLARRRAALPGATWPPEEGTSGNPPGARWVSEHRYIHADFSRRKCSSSPGTEAEWEDRFWAKNLNSHVFIIFRNWVVIVTVSGGLYRVKILATGSPLR